MEPNQSPKDAASAGTDPVYPGKGFRLGDYVIERVLGRGSMASVFLARDSDGHEAAIKVFVEGAGVSAIMLERFRREAEASKKLRHHPQILTVYETGKEGPYHYIVMESIQRSKTLEDALESTPLSISDILVLHIKIAGALQFAHERRIVHRDVKPTNILIDEFGEPRLSDFGVAALTDWPACTMTGALTGTPLYMSPEQARSERTGPASDVYSLGVVLYEALTGTLPYHTAHGAPVREVLKAVTTEEPRRPRLFRKEISADLEAVILKALEKSPDRRYPDAASFAADMERALIGRPVSARRFSPMDHIYFRLRRHRPAVLAVLGVAIAAFLAYRHYHEKLVRVQYEGLVHYAQLKNALLQQYAPPHMDVNPEERQRAWRDIRLARAAMRGSDWTRAQLMLRSAVGTSAAIGDARTAAIAMLDEARSSLMSYGQDRALLLYRDIMLNPDASPATQSMAQIESMMIALLRQDEALAIALLKSNALPPDGPFLAALRCLGGELSPEDLLAKLPTMPPRFRNDTHLVAAIRYYADGITSKSVAQLKACIQASDPRTEWPAPYARMLHSDLIQ